MLDDIFNKLRKNAEEGEVKESRGIKSCFLIFRKKKLSEIMSALESVLKNKRGEKIVCDIEKGEIEDMGIASFEIKKGKTIEFYDYDKLSACFIRAYEISRKNESDFWIALYIDENPLTPWWSKEEREEEEK